MRRNCYFLVFISLIFAGSAMAQDSFLDQAHRRIDQHRKADIKVEVRDADGNLVNGAKVKVEMKNHQFRWGTAVVAARIIADTPDDVTYKQKLLENFNAVVFENDLKWPAWEGAWGDGFGWVPTQKAFQWLAEKGLPVRGHYIAWATLSGDDGFGPNKKNADGVRQRLFDHIKRKLTTVGDRVVEWDVINHPVGWGPDTYEDKLGLKFYADIISHARSLVPKGTELWMNEDNILTGSEVADGYERVLKYLLANNATVDGIGIQGHFKTSWGRNAKDTTEKIYTQLERFSKIIPRIQLTEFDIDVGKFDENEKLISYDQEEHAKLMHNYLVSAFSHPSLEGITMWGFWEGAHWMSSAALFNKDWSERPALKAYRSLVYDKWWTRQTGVTNDAGVFELRGFKGDYEITVEHAGKTYTQKHNTQSPVAKFTLGK